MTLQTPTKDLASSAQRNVATLFAPLQREFNRFFDELGDGFTALTELRFSPRMDVVETKDGLNVTVEVPGLSREDVKISAEDDMLTVSGEKSETKEKTEGAAHLTERSFGRFARSIYLPRSVDASKITASMKDGILKLEIPKRADAQAKTIEIQSK